MTTLYVGIGHGIEPDGTYDPGAVHGGLVEHDLARQVVEAMTAALTRSGFHDFIAEHSPAGRPTDPDYRGSVIRANAAHAAYVIEVHFNAGGGGSGHGTETLCFADDGLTGQWAHRVQSRLNAAVGIVNRGVKVRTDLWLLRASTGHALIPEVAFIDGDNVNIKDHPRLCTGAGEALAHATLEQLGHAYVSPTADRWQVDVAGKVRSDRAPNMTEALAYARHALVGGAPTVTIRRVKA